MTSLTLHCDARGASAGLVGRVQGGAKSRTRAPEAVLVTQVRPACIQLRPALAHRLCRPGPLPPAASLGPTLAFAPALASLLASFVKVRGARQGAQPGAELPWGGRAA